jgi:hypothetical protein
MRQLRPLLLFSFILANHSMSFVQSQPTDEARERDEIDRDKERGKERETEREKGSLLRIISTTKII